MQNYETSDGAYWLSPDEDQSKVTSGRARRTRMVKSGSASRIEWPPSLFTGWKKRRPWTSPGSKERNIRTRKGTKLGKLKSPWMSMGMSNRITSEGKK